MHRAKDPNQINAHSKRFSGIGKSLDLPPIGRERNIKGIDALDGAPPGTAGERGTKKYDIEGGYHGNVQGPMSKSFKTG